MTTIQTVAAAIARQQAERDALFGPAPETHYVVNAYWPGETRPEQIGSTFDYMTACQWRDDAHADHRHDDVTICVETRHSAPVLAGIRKARARRVERNRAMSWRAA